MTYDTLFVNPNGRTARADFIPAAITVIAAIAFFTYIVPGRTSQFCVLTLLYPAFVLLARRLQDMSKSGWLALAPALLLVVSLLIRLKYFSFGEPIDNAVTWAGLAIAAALALWGCAKK